MKCFGPLSKRSILVLCAGSCLCFNIVPAALGFTTLSHEFGLPVRTFLINKVHKPHWTIHYSFKENCGEVDKETQEKFTQVVTKFIQSWLQPLREYTDTPIVNDFRYRLDANWHGADFGIIHSCEREHDHAVVVHPIGIKSSSAGLELKWRWTINILHELGHLFGLADTYVRLVDRGRPGLSTGGRDSTKGSQPVSIMSGFNLFLLKQDWDQLILAHQGMVMLNEDDKNGILWLYKYTYEGLSLRDCFFLNYEWEALPPGCVPKYPLIFELQYSTEKNSLLIIEEDKGLDLNARDANGMTALHHAVINGYMQVVEALLAEDTITVNIFNNARRTPAQMARELKLLEIAKHIEAHPTAKLPPWSVIPTDKLTTTWGHLKKQY